MNHYMISALVIILALVMFFWQFESRKPDAKFVVLIAILTALTVASRSAFSAFPQVKPVTALVILTGVTLGARNGFLVGALSGFISNFFFGQGPWTPWQMVAWGLMGGIAGLLFHKSSRSQSVKVWKIVVFGLLGTILIYGVIMDTQSMLFMLGKVGLQEAILRYSFGFPYNVVHGVSTAVFLTLFSHIFMKILNRILLKYGMVGA